MKKPYLGCIPSLADPRDYSLSVVADVEYPAKFNVTDVPIYDQGNIGRCVMEALRSAPHAATGVERAQRLDMATGAAIPERA